MSRNYFNLEALLHHLALKRSNYNFKIIIEIIMDFYLYTSIIRIGTKFNIFFTI